MSDRSEKNAHGQYLIFHDLKNYLMTYSTNPSFYRHYYPHGEAECQEKKKKKATEQLLSKNSQYLPKQGDMKSFRVLQTLIYTSPCINNEHS